MEKPALIDQFSSVYFCFRYDRAALDCMEPRLTMKKRNGREAALWRPARLHPYHLKVHVAGMLVGEAQDSFTGAGAESAVGRLYSLDDGVRRDLGLPDARCLARLQCRGQEAPVDLRLSDVRLALFCTGIGILEFTFRMQGGADAVLNANYALAEVKSDGNRILHTLRLGKDEVEEHSDSLIDWVEALLRPLGGVEDFDTRSGLRFIDNKPPVFTWLLLSAFPEDLGSLLFGLRTNFKASYKVPARELDPDGAPAVYHPFENLYWAVSLNGAACCAALTGDEKTDGFFRSAFAGNLRDTYVLLYLLRLHQRFMIQDLRDRFAGAGQALTEVRGSAIEGVYRAAEALKDEAALFRLRSFFLAPSSVEHINRYDALLSEVLGIEESYGELRRSLLLLEQLSSAAREALRKREETKKQIRALRRERVIYLASAFWSMVLLFQSACEIMDRVLGTPLAVSDPLILIPVLIAVAPAAKLLFDFREKGAQLRSLEESLGAEDEKAPLR